MNQLPESQSSPKNAFSPEADQVFDAYFSYSPTPELLSEELSPKQLDTLSKFPTSVQKGLSSMFRYIYIRGVINDFMPESADKRTFEKQLRERMNSLDTSIEDAADYWHELHLLHHCSVTADQAELSRAAFL